MIVDTSAILVLVQNEPRKEEVCSALIGDKNNVIAAPTATECLIVLTARFGPVGRTVFDRIRSEFNITIGDYTDAHVTAALRAFSRFGKGKHPAGLNYGDCMSYAAAYVNGQPLLAVGDDFTRTDLYFHGGVVGYWRQ